jgi:hypothetical protein
VFTVRWTTELFCFATIAIAALEAAFGIEVRLCLAAVRVPRLPGEHLPIAAALIYGYCGPQRVLYAHDAYLKLLCALMMQRELSQGL